LKPVKVLIRIYDASPIQENASTVSVIAATQDVEFYVLDCRKQFTRKVDLGECKKVATEQDFAEAVWDALYKAPPHIRDEFDPAVMQTMVNKLSK